MLKKKTGTTKKQFQQQNNQLICNMKQPCSYLRNEKFITDWVRKYKAKN